MAFWHATFGYPSKSSFIKNIRNGNISVDGLSTALARKFFTPSVCTAFGHLDATRSNIKSTKEKFQSEANHEHKQPLIWMGLHESTGRLHSDQTGQVPIFGRHNEKYISIFLMSPQTIYMLKCL